VRTARDTKWDTILTHGTSNGTLFCRDGTPFCHDGTLFCHDGTPICQDGTQRDTNGHHFDVRRRYGQEKARGGASTRFSGAERPKNEVRVSKADLEPFGDFGCLWYNPLYRFSAQQGRRHGVRSRSLGGTFYIPSRNRVQLVNRPAGRFLLLAPWAPVTCTRVEAWTSYRGGDCENKQGRDLDFLQGARLRKQTGQKLGHHTGGKAGRTYRIEAWTSNRG
jgi:hypothetical protein